MEVAPETTAETDVGDKRAECAALGIPEYRRFDKSFKRGSRFSARRNSSGVGKGIYKSVVQSDREFLNVGVSDRQ